MSTLQRTESKPINLSLKFSHEAQIQALTEEGLSDEERVRRFADLVGVGDVLLTYALNHLHVGGCSPAKAVWFLDTPKSLFGSLPGCKCPVIEVQIGRASYPGIPAGIRHNWHPDRATLEAFARVQMEHRT